MEKHKTASHQCTLTLRYVVLSPYEKGKEHKRNNHLHHFNGQACMHVLCNVNMKGDFKLNNNCKRAMMLMNINKFG